MYTDSQIIELQARALYIHEVWYIASEFLHFALFVGTACL